MTRWLACLMLFAAAVSVPGWPRATELSSLEPPQPEDLIWVTDDDASPLSGGCDAITVVDGRSGTPLTHGGWRDSISRLVVASDRSTAVSPLKGNPPQLYVLRRQADKPDDWDTQLPSLQGTLDLGPVALSPDDRWLLLSLDVPGEVGKYGVAGMSPRAVGPLLGKYYTGGSAPAVILFGADPHTVYVADVAGQLHTVDVDSMLPRDGAVAFEPPATGRGGWRGRMNRSFGTLSPNGRYLVLNGGLRNTISVIDLATSNVGIVAARGLSETWGVAFNYIGPHAGLLAVHGRNKVAVFEFRGVSAPALLAAADVPPQRPHLTQYIKDTWPRPGSLAWGGRGDSVIATIGSKKEFRVLEYSDVGAPALTAKFDFDACTSDLAIEAAVDVVTLNRPAFVPTPTASARPDPSPTATPELPTPTASATPTSTPADTPRPTPTASQTPSPTPTPGSIYLPLSLREACVPGKQRVDVALVIDASSSMDEGVAAGQSKLDAAVAAVRAFLDQLALPRDQAALIAYNRDPHLLQMLTGDRALLVSALARIAVAQQTRIDLGIEAARQELKSRRHRAGNQPVLILLTDGKANPVPVDVAVAKARIAKADGITIFTIGLGADVALDVDALRRMASRPEYFYLAPDGEDLGAIYQTIAVTIPCPAEDFWGRR